MKLKFLCLFFLIVFIHNQAVAKEVGEKIESWWFTTRTDEMNDKVISRHGSSPIAESKFYLIIKSYSNCSHSFSLMSLHHKLVPRLRRAKELIFRIRVDKNTMMLVSGEVEKFINDSLVIILLNEDKVTYKKLVNQMLVGKELLIDFNPNNYSNINPEPMIARIDLNGFNEVYKRMCKK